MLVGDLVTLEPVNETSFELLAQWTLDPAAQGSYKRVPELSVEELRRLFFDDPDRRYFLIRRTADGCPLGRFYYRAWRFGGGPAPVDWELNILLADPAERGKGYGTAAQRLAVEHLLGLAETRSVFAYTDRDNVAERRALANAGLRELGLMPVVGYPIDVPPGRYVLYAVRRQGPAAPAGAV